MTKSIQLVAALFIFFGIALSGYAVAAGKWPWQRRIGSDVEIHHKQQHEERVKPEMWPTEPPSPDEINSAQFIAALRILCGHQRVGPERGQKFGAAILTNAATFEVDPFLVAGLIYDQSRCLPKQPPNETRRYGLSRIDVQMHAPHIRNQNYDYWIFENDEWVAKSLSVEKYPFNLWKAANPISNIYWTAAILRVFKEQQTSLATAFADAFQHKPHRHYVSHWFFGDNVQSSEPEDRVLTARRRLLEYYHDTQVASAGDYHGVPLVSPLDGVPRMVLDDFNRWRGKKRTGHRHMGMDFVSELDEPIRAVADGKVIFVGVDMPNAGSKRMTGEEATRFDPRKMGDGGRYVAIRHAEGLRTYYMHMDTIVAEDQTQIKAGEIIGTVGRSGSTHSGPHLHLEFRVDKDREDPAEYMQKVLVDPKRWSQTHAGVP
ncbi:MAG: M23 family metallopeptidase [Deltaproteobacteria bacterium]|nr:M23 family metallopeptidase [Deltaproteobacteria bacterium]MBN2674132.1 M23 family metallopeptidase [Deltaproteobacteria bacterium]